MSIYLPALGGVLGAVGGSVLAAVLPGEPAKIVIIAGAVAGFVLWELCPLPRTVGFQPHGLSDPLNGSYWGLHPGPLGEKPTEWSRSEVGDGVIYRFDDGYLAVSRETRDSAWGSSPEAALDQLADRRS